MKHQDLNNSQLGKKSQYATEYNPNLLFAIARQKNREIIGVTQPLPFYGVDVWNAYEVSWLNAKGKPQIMVLEVIVPCDSPNIFESKSLKLYLNSFNSTGFKDKGEVLSTIATDLSQVAGKAVSLRERCVDHRDQVVVLPGQCLDNLDVACQHHAPNPRLLKTGAAVVQETLHSHLLKSNCPVTGQPDWASLLISYQGAQIDHASLLQYIVSFRGHDEFHEHCVETLFMQMSERCQPQQLSICAYYTRRGGIDINPMRSSEADFQAQIRRLCRQ